MRIIHLAGSGNGFHEHWPRRRGRWTAAAIAQLHRKSARSADTHLLHRRFDGFPGIDFYFKDEAELPTGSLKQRLAQPGFTGKRHPHHADPGHQPAAG